MTKSSSATDDNGTAAIGGCDQMRAMTMIAVAMHDGERIALVD